MSDRIQVKQDLRLSFPAELRLLLECADQQPDAEQKDRIRHAAGHDIDWTAFLRLTQRHRVVPHAYRALSRAAADLVPQSFMDALAQRFHANTKNNLLVGGELARICRAMNGARIPLMCCKGPALAIQAYGGLHCRQFRDLDLLVPAEKVVAAACELNQLGFLESDGAPPLSSLSRSQQNRLTKFHKHIVFRRKDSPAVMVELHWHLADHDMLIIAPDRLWSNDHTITFAGMPLFVLPPLEQIIYLAWHGGQHRWKRLSWLFDLSQALANYADVDWQLLERTAFEMGMQRYIALGLAMARLLVGTKVPAVAFSQMDVHRAVARSCHAMLADEQYYEKKPFAFIVWTWQMWPRMPYCPRALFHKLAPEISQIHLSAPHAYLNRLLGLERRVRQRLLARFRKTKHGTV